MFRVQLPPVNFSEEILLKNAFFTLLSNQKSTIKSDKVIQQIL